MSPPDPGTLALGFGFAMLALAIIGWIAAVVQDLPNEAPELYRRVSKVTGPVFDAAPAEPDVKKSALPIRITVERIIPIIFWLLIVVPMVVFPIILVLMPLLHVPWSYLLPSSP